MDQVDLKYEFLVNTTVDYTNNNSNYSISSIRNYMRYAIRQNNSYTFKYLNIVNINDLLSYDTILNQFEESIPPGYEVNNQTNNNQNSTTSSTSTTPIDYGIDINIYNDCLLYSQVYLNQFNKYEVAQDGLTATNIPQFCLDFRNDFIGNVIS